MIHRLFRRPGAAVAVLWILFAAPAAQAQPKLPSDRPWMNTTLGPDERAALLEQALTLAEKLALLHSNVGAAFRGEPLPAGALGSAGFVPGVPRLGVPALQETDAGLGVTNPQGVRPGDAATALPATLGLAASWNPELAYRSGVVIGTEARLKGFNVLLAGGMNLARDPRNGRNFEYFGEDPLLAGVLAGETVRGIQSQHVISTVKHFALNGQETGRFVADAHIAEDALRESDLLAFEIAIERGEPGSVMCAYNLVNGHYACGNDWLLNRVLKGDWQFPGWVMSDWGAVDSLDYALEGLDQQSGAQIDTDVYFGEPLTAAVADGTVPEARIGDMTRRILRSMFAVGLFDHAYMPGEIDYEAHAEEARAVAEQSIVVLRNEGGILPLPKGGTIAVIGGWADLGVMSGAGSSQVTAVGIPARIVPMGGEGPLASWRHLTLHPSPPTAALRVAAPDADVHFIDSRYPSAAAEAASRADVAIVFATQWMIEHFDAPDLTLPNGQDAVIAAVAAANPNTIVVLETGGPVLMPWRDDVAAVVAAWYPGQQGGTAIANVLFGNVEPAGRLPITFPAREADLPRPKIPGWGLPEGQGFVIEHPEGADVGYRWFARRGKAPIYPFGYGLSFTTFDYEGLEVSGARDVRVEFEVTNTGQRAGWAVPQLYLTAARGTPELRLLGWSKAFLAPGETKQFSVTVDPRLLAEFDTSANRWSIAAGDYEIALGDSSASFAARAKHKIAARTLPP